MRRVLTNILVILFLITGLEAAHRPTHPDPISKHSKTSSHRRHKRTKPYQVGKASWYGKLFQGKPTASGEPYNMFQFTAAHRDLPMGTLVRVTNVATNQSIVVRVNDRGPVPSSRIMDLSYLAAEVIGVRAPGVQVVRLDIVAPPTQVAELDGTP
jgi:rare lipoprotein A